MNSALTRLDIESQKWHKQLPIGRRIWGFKQLVKRRDRRSKQNKWSFFKIMSRQYNQIGTFALGWIAWRRCALRWCILKSLGYQSKFLIHTSIHSVRNSRASLISWRLAMLPVSMLSFSSSSTMHLLLLTTHELRWLSVFLFRNWFFVFIKSGSLRIQAPSGS